MASTIEEGFSNFLAKLTSPFGEPEVIQVCRDSLEACLKVACDMQDIFLGGSYDNDTNIDGHSRIDFFACFPANQQYNNSGAILSQVRNALNEHFPHKPLPISCPSINVYIDPTNEATVIPVYYKRTEAGYAVYEMPDCQSEWLNLSPEAHKAYIYNIDQKHGGKAKRLIRLVKAWKYYQGIDISSFYLELVIAKYAERKSTIDYSKGTRDILDWLNKSRLPMIWDPAEISGRIYPAASETAWKTAKKKLPMAARYAIKAVDEENNGNTQAALEYWNLFFNHQFLPSEP